MDYMEMPVRSSRLKRGEEEQSAEAKVKINK